MAKGALKNPVSIVGYRYSGKSAKCVDCTPYASDEIHPVYSDSSGWNLLTCSECGKTLGEKALSVVMAAAQASTCDLCKAPYECVEHPMKPGAPMSRKCKCAYTTVVSKTPT